MRLLLVEDNRDVARWLAEILRGSRYTVDVAHDGAEAEDFLRVADYALMILDLALPRVDGLAVLRGLRGRRDAMPVIVLTADASLDLRANPHQDAEGVALEAHLDRGRGPVATVLVTRGTLKIGESVVAGDAFGRVRAMLDENGDQIQEAGPSRPVLVLGLTSVPGAGDSLMVVDEDRIARARVDLGGQW